MAHTYEELKGKTVAELRAIAAGIPGDERVTGHSQMNKERLLPALCAALGIDVHEHHEVTGIDKAAIKASLRRLKQQRDDAIAAHDEERLKNVRRQMHHLNHLIRAHMS